MTEAETRPGIGVSQETVRELGECPIGARGGIRTATLQTPQEPDPRRTYVILAYFNCLTGEMTSLSTSEDGCLPGEQIYDELQYTDMAPDTQGAAAVATICTAKPRDKVT